jgi:hypothetical protein
MKKALILSVLAAAAVSPLANAAGEVCAGAAAGATVAITTTADMFVIVPFTAQCSANVYSNYAEDATRLGVVAGSKKGKNYFGGSTNGGGIRPQGACAATGCSTSEVSNTNAIALRDAS